MPNRARKTPDFLRALLTVQDVAQLDRCSEKTVRRAIAAGLLPIVRIGPAGRLVRIDPAAHAAYRLARGL
jgi:excisionase family DNA binding protein